MSEQTVNLLRYPGGKQRLWDHMKQHLPPAESIRGRFVEPFVGGGAVFFALRPSRALLADINLELMDLYRGIRRYPNHVWSIFCQFPPTKEAYYKVRDLHHDELDLPTRAARTLYLNRTCFKGMWRHNSEGEFNIGYGGQDRRWVISQEDMVYVSKRLWSASLKCCDFEEVIDACKDEDFIFVDPPYRPGEREMIHAHYRYGRFSFNDHKRLANTLRKASRRGIRWAMTTSAHSDITDLFREYHGISIPRGTGKRIGALTKDSGEILIRNYGEVAQ